MLNLVCIQGNLGKAPEVRMVREKAACSFSVALNERWKDANGQPQERTSWVDVEAWGRTAELCGQYLVAGSKVIVQGKLRQDVWEKDGEKRSKIKVIADSVQFMDARREGPQDDEPTPTRAETAKRAPPKAMPVPIDDEPPF